MAAARDQFRRVAGRYAKSRAHSDKRFLSRMVALARLGRGERVLDLATGPGFVGVEFAKKGAEVIGTDITKEMLTHAKELRKRNGVPMEFVLAEASHQPFRDESFDIAVSRLAFHHMKDPAAALQSMKRVVRPRGRIVIADLVVSEDSEVADFHNEFERLRDPSHVRSLRLSEWKNLYRKLGLRLDKLAQSKVQLEVTEWAERAGFPMRRVSELTTKLERAPAKTRRTMNVFRRSGLLFFLNTRAILVGTRQEKSTSSQRAFLARRGKEP
jgi:ubiquinone/menaquinone biosynthesis C-methylase UbiE